MFHELLGFNVVDGRSIDETRRHRDVAAALARRIACAYRWRRMRRIRCRPKLFRAIRAEVSRSRVPITSVHLGESPGEMEFLKDGTGPWPGILRMVGATATVGRRRAWDRSSISTALVFSTRRRSSFTACSWTTRALLDWPRLDVPLVTCPRSNQWVGVGVPPIARFYASGVNVAVGTDSLASVEDLNPFCELKTMRWLAPMVPARQLLESATLTGARALGFGRRAWLDRNRQARGSDCRGLAGEAGARDWGRTRRHG